MANLQATVKFPFGPAPVTSLTAAGAQALIISGVLTLVDGVTVEATSDRTLNLTIDSETLIGSRIVVLSKTNGTETTVFGTGITGATITGVAGKTICTEFIYDGTAFKQTGAQQQID